MNTTQNNTLAIFDLDNTLLNGDSDHAWGEFLISQKLVDSDAHRKQNDQFYADYCKGELDIDRYLQFALSITAGKTVEELKPLHQQFMADYIQPMQLPAAHELLKQHRDKGHYLLIITATNSFVTHPIAKALGVDDILASDAEIIDGRYTGKPCGVPCFQHGKVERLKHWMTNKPYRLEESFFYSDSHNDLPLLKAVGHPVAVDPDQQLARYAYDHDWRIISLREKTAG